MQKRCTVPIFDLEYLETLKRLFLFEFFGTVQRFCSSEPKRLGQYSTSGPPGVENTVLSQCFWVQACKNAVLSQCFLGPGMQKRCTVPKNSNKSNLFRVSRSKIGTVRCFCFSVSKRLALQALQVQKTLYCPNLFGSSHAKTLYCPNL